MGDNPEANPSGEIKISRDSGARFVGYPRKPSIISGCRYLTDPGPGCQVHRELSCLSAAGGYRDNPVAGEESQLECLRGALGFVGKK